MKTIRELSNNVLRTYARYMRAIDRASVEHACNPDSVAYRRAVRSEEAASESYTRAKELERDARRALAGRRR